MENIKENFKKYSMYLIFFILFVFVIHTTLSFVFLPKKMEKSTQNALSNVSAKEIKDNTKEFKDKGKMIDLKKISKNSFPFVSDFSLDDVLGGIYIPKINLTLPITSTVNKEYKNISAVAVKPNQEMGKDNYILASNSTFNKKLLFTSIIYLNEGDKVFMTDKDKIYLYEVVSRKKVDMDRDYILEHLNKTSELTLITKYKNKETEKLIVVQAELKSVANYRESGDKLKNIFGN